MSATAGKALPDGYKRWLVVSVAVLLFSLMLFVCNIIAGFVYFSTNTTPLWVTVLSGVAIFGMLVGFGGLFLLLALAGIKAYRAQKGRAHARG